MNVPTKPHWRSPSRLEDVASDARALAAKVAELGIRSVAVPPLGCGNGGLDWSDVRPLLLSNLGRLAAEVILLPPAGSPEPADMPNRSETPPLTAERADALARIEIQKLAYLAQVFAGTAEHGSSGVGTAPTHTAWNASSRSGKGISSLATAMPRTRCLSCDLSGWCRMRRSAQRKPSPLASAQQAYDVIASWSHLAARSNRVGPLAIHGVALGACTGRLITRRRPGRCRRRAP